MLTSHRPGSGNGYTNEYPVNRYLRDALLYKVGAGTMEVRRMLIGREFSESRRSRAYVILGTDARQCLRQRLCQHVDIPFPPLLSHRSASFLLTTNRLEPRIGSFQP